MAGRAEDYDFKTMQQVAACGYEPIERKGAGSYGFVYQVEDVNGEIYAFKYILPSDDYKEYGLDSLNEIDILSRVQHPHIIHAPKIITSYNCEIDGLAIILPLADRTLHDIIRDNRATTDVKLPILYKLATAMEFMHRSGILHLDIKSTNVVLQDLQANIPYFIDFGLCMIADNAATGKYNPRVLVTIDHRAPEILSGGRIYNAAVDVWAFGIMMLYILSGQNIFSDINFRTITPEAFAPIVIDIFSTPDLIAQKLSGVREKYRAQCIDLISRILNVNPLLRLTAKQICDHPLFDEVRLPVDGQLIVPPIYYSYAPDHRDILKVMITWARNLYAESRVEMLFLAVDLYNRMGSYYKDKTPAQRMSLAATCLWMAAKLTNDIFIPLLQYVNEITKSFKDITTNSILQDEIMIVHTLEGVLNVSQLYRICDNGDELDLSLRYIILARDSTLYARAKISEWSVNMKNFIQEIRIPTKDIKILTLIQQ
jgi:cyclin-dependent kinase